MLRPPLWPLRTILFCPRRVPCFQRIRNVSPTAYFSSCWQKVCRRRHDSIEVTRRRHKREKHPVGDDKKRKLPHRGPVHTLL